MWIVSALGLYILVSIFSSGTSDPNARWKFSVSPSVRLSFKCT